MPRFNIQTHDCARKHRETAQGRALTVPGSTRAEQQLPLLGALDAKQRRIYWGKR